MISQITLKNFKSIKSTTLRLGMFNLFIGTNASGKSNFFDALRFLQGVGWGMSLDEILNGRPRTGMGSEWEGIRGGSSAIGYQEPNAKEDAPAKQIGIEVRLRTTTSRFPQWFNYGLNFNAKRGSVRSEWFDDEFDTRSIENPLNSAVIKARYEAASRKGRKPHLEFEKHKPVLTQIADRPEVEKSTRLAARRTLEFLSSIQRLDPSPAMLRQYSTAREVDRMGEHGENFAALVQSIRDDIFSGETPFLNWLRELRPAEVDEIVILKGALKEPMFALKEKGRVFPAPVLSDGTLRFAAIAAAFFQPSMPGVLMLEEIENGVHAGRLRPLMELLKSRAGSNETQVLATTHSALLLDWLQPEDYSHVFLCSRDMEDGSTKITPLSEVPHFLEAVKSTPASQLITEGWMEMAL